MAQHMVGSQIQVQFANPKRATAGSVAVTGPQLTGPAIYTDISALDTALNTASASTYPQRVLDQMNVNDKIYAYRVLSDAGTI